MAANGYQQAPQRNVVGHIGMTHRAEENCIEGAQLFETVFGHHATAAAICLAAPIEILPGEIEAEALARGIEHVNSLWHDLKPDSITGDHCNLVAFRSCHRHRSSECESADIGARPGSAANARKDRACR